MPVYPYALDRPAHPPTHRLQPRSMPIPSPDFRSPAYEPRNNPLRRLASDMSPFSERSDKTDGSIRTASDVNQIGGDGFSGLMNRLNQEGHADSLGSSPFTGNGSSAYAMNGSDSVNANDEEPSEAKDLDMLSSLPDHSNEMQDELEEGSRRKRAMGGGSETPKWETEMPNIPKPQPLKLRPRRSGRRGLLNRS